MENIKVIYFKGCPNADRVRALLDEVGLTYEEVEQTALPEGDPLKAFTSPSILKGDQLIFGAKTEEGSGCSLGIPNLHELRYRLGLSSN